MTQEVLEELNNELGEIDDDVYRRKRKPKLIMLLRVKILKSLPKKLRN